MDKSDKSNSTKDNIFLIGKKLGKGSFGSVYEVENELGEKYAVKTIDTKGYNYIMEASITSTYKHPNIVSCEDIFIENGKLYIVQIRAIGDLMMLSRNNPIKLDKARTYIYSIAKAINFLHLRNIIHGDIKASNIFLYNDNTVKLGDFSVSVLSIRNKYKHKISTPSHNPPECFIGEEWSFPIDMWGFGCTIYEIIYGMNIFPNQKESAIFDKIDMLKLCVFTWLADTEGISINIDISKNTNNIDNTIDSSDSSDSDDTDDDDDEEIPITTVKHSKLFYNKKYKLVNDLILKLLKCDPNKRLISQQTLQHNFFTNVVDSDEEYLILKNKKHDLTLEDIKNFELYDLVDYYNISDLSLKILSLCSKEFRDNNSNVNEMCIVTAFILSKIKIPERFKEFNPEKLMVYLGYSIHESLS